MDPAIQFDRTHESVGNIVLLEHVNVTQNDQRPTSIFWLQGLGCTRDPYMHVSDGNMWINIGRQQIHSPTNRPQVLRGQVGVVMPDFEIARAGLASIGQKLDGTRFAWDDQGDVIDATCPWGNRIRCHAPQARFGPMRLGIPYVELPVARGAAAGIARFYQQILQAPARLEAVAGVASDAAAGGLQAAHVCAGAHQEIIYRETDAPIAPYDGHHIALYVADFARTHAELQRHGLISEESDQWQYRFEKIVDPDSGAHLFTLEHEVRSLTHPMFGRPLVNRNALQRQRPYLPGQDAFF